mgnify:CR=1 FL=1
MKGWIIMDKKWIIFDVMGVIFTVGDDTNDLLVPYIQNINKDISRKKINEVYLKASLGHINSAQFWEELNVADSDKYAYIEKKYLDECLTIDEQFIDVATRLKKNYNLAILSNDVSEWGEYLREKYGINDVVDYSIISGDVGLRKPSKEIYGIVLKKIGVEAKDCLFIDDRDKNLVPAMEIGMQVVKFLRDDTECKLTNVITVDSFVNFEKILSQVW